MYEERIRMAELAFKFASNPGRLWYMFIYAKKPCTCEFWKAGKFVGKVVLTQ